MNRPLSPRLTELHTKKLIRFGNGSDRNQENRVAVPYGAKRFNKVVQGKCRNEHGNDLKNDASKSGKKSL